MTRTDRKAHPRRCNCDEHPAGFTNAEWTGITVLVVLGVVVLLALLP